MLIVTGTKRSGTSMWMQILIAAGFPAFGEAFPANWGSTLRDANPAGFFESILRQGIYWRTNPHPRTGAYFFPEQVERHVVKVFIPGLVRSDRAFIGRVVATMRNWREYTRSLARLHAMENRSRREQRPGSVDPVRFPPALEWWCENFALVRDIAIRRYPVHVQSYDGLLADPEQVIRRTLEWIGDPAINAEAAQAAVAAVDAGHRTQQVEAPEDEAVTTGIEGEHAAVFDELYARVDGGGGLDGPFVTKLNEINQQLLPRIQAAQRAVYDDQAARRQQRAAAGEALAAELEGEGPLPPTTMDWGSAGD